MKLKEEKSRKNKSYLIYFIIGIFIIILIIVYFSFFRLDINVKSNKILRCPDGTAYDSCSSNKLYCSNGNLISNPVKCGCIEGLTLIVDKCKNATEFLPGTNITCKELAPRTASVSFNSLGYPIVLIDLYNSLSNNLPLKNAGQDCLNHLPPKAGENINVENLFSCYGSTSFGGGVDSSGIVKRSYKISYELNMDKSNCINISSLATGSDRKCNVNSFNCSWSFTN
jgi:hypothetical protein